MREATVTFYKLIQDSQDLGGDDEHMVSRIYFRVRADSETGEGTLDLKQMLGSKLTEDSVEVSAVKSAIELGDYQKLRSEAAQYYLSLVGENGSAMRLGGSGNVRMRNNTFMVEKSITVALPESRGGW